LAIVNADTRRATVPTLFAATTPTWIRVGVHTMNMFVLTGGLKMSYIQQHIEDHCKTAQDVREAAQRVARFRGNLAPKPVKIERRPAIYDLIDKASLIPRQPDPKPVNIVDKTVTVLQLKSNTPTIKEIQLTVARVFGVPLMDILSPRRNKRLVLVRHVGIVLCRLLTCRSYPEIGRRTGGRDHSSILHCVQKYQWLTDKLNAEMSLESPVKDWVTCAFNIVTALELY